MARRSAAAVVGLVLSVLGLCFFPLAIVGLILGIVGLGKTKRDPELEGRGIAVAATIVGAVALAFAAVQIAIAVPAFTKYMQRSKSAEAVVNLGSLRSSLEQYRAEHGRYPASIPRTPASPSCDPAPFPRGPAWAAIGFDPGLVRFAYELETTADGLSWMARAIGDLDCDGVPFAIEAGSDRPVVMPTSFE
jgi:type II secretory pathway pseudopilin PulG